MVPSINSDLLTGGLYTPSDGKCSPIDVSYSLTALCQKAGVKIVQDVLVNRLSIQNNNINRVETSAGDIKAGLVINSAGLWANHISKMTYRDLHTTSLEHQYAIYDSLFDLKPTIRDPDAGTYFKTDSEGRLVVGGWEKSGLKTVSDSNSWHFEDLDADDDRFE